MSAIETINMKALVLTLGHGSSAILIEDNKIVNGYMNERITKTKSDSAFPLEAIEEILKFDTIPENVTVYISHWEPTGNLDSMSKRHWNPDYLNRRFPKHKIKSLNIDFTHHMAHACSALAYFKKIPNNTHIIVADGFGNYGEVLSVYKIEHCYPIPVFTSYGYSSSLGLLYQYATDFCGLKMNQDEWKLNAAATNVNPDDISFLTRIALETSSNLMAGIEFSSMSHDDPMTELGALSYTHKEVVDLLNKHFEPHEKANIAFFLQKVVESVFITIIKRYNIKNVILVGGVFMNVQLNGYLARHIPGKIGVMPLSGDSGAGLGIYKAWNPSFMIPDDFCWGKRDLSGIKEPGIHYTKKITSSVLEMLSKGYIVNVVRGKMEFGERAYCNTSTIAYPTKENCAIINIANGRDSTMPMAPVITDRQYVHVFDFTSKVIQSVQHMIMSLPYKIPVKSIDGVAHYLPESDIHTGRPQVISQEHYLSEVCEEYGLLINTSFNIHGQPICLTTKDIVKAHKYQQEHDKSNKFITLIEEEL